MVFLKCTTLAKKANVAISIWNSVVYTSMKIFQVFASSSRLCVFFTAFPNQEFDVSSLTCRPRPPGNPLGEMEWELSVQWKFLPGHSLGNVHRPNCSLMLAKRVYKSRELHAVKTDFAWNSRNRAHCLSVYVLPTHTTVFQLGWHYPSGSPPTCSFPCHLPLFIDRSELLLWSLFPSRVVSPGTYLHNSPCSETSSDLHP